MHSKATIRITDLLWLKVIKVRTANQEGEDSANLEVEIARPHIRDFVHERRRIIFQNPHTLLNVTGGIFSATPQKKSGMKSIARKSGVVSGDTCRISSFSQGVDRLQRTIKKLLV